MCPGLGCTLFSGQLLMTTSPEPLDRAEYVEQAYLFRLLRERLREEMPMQDLLAQAKHELLATTKLPMAIDFLLTELNHTGLMYGAMQRLGHYFNSFQTFLIEQAESETGRFSMLVALHILEADAKYRSEGATCEGMFLFQFESLCRNRLNYDKGLTAISSDPLYDTPWASWILRLRAHLGLVDFGDLVFLASKDYEQRLVVAGEPTEGKGPFLFGVKEGKIAFGNRRKDPLFLFAGMQRHLGYPPVPRPEPIEQEQEIIPQLARRIERLSMRIKLLEEEQRAGIDITKFYEQNKDRLQFPQDD